MVPEVEVGETASASQRTPRIHSHHQKTEETEKDPTQSIRRTMPCRHFDFGLLVSRTVREHISTILC